MVSELAPRRARDPASPPNRAREKCELFLPIVADFMCKCAVEVKSLLAEVAEDVLSTLETHLRAHMVQ